MRRFHPAWLPAIVLCSFLGWGCSDAKPADQLDGASVDAGGQKADTGSADIPVPQPDVPLPQPDARRGDVVLLQPDGNVRDSVPSQPDGAGGDSHAPRLDSSVTEAGPPLLDGRALDTGSAVPDPGASKEEIIRACVLATSCSADGPYRTHSDCLDYFGLTASRPNDVLLAHLLACAGAKTCSEFRSCWGGDVLTLETVWVGGTCHGNALTFTPADTTLPPVQFDCGAIGGVCELLASSSISYGCNVRSCKAPLAPSCDGATASGCGGWGEYTSIDCARTGRICRIDGMHAVCDGTEGAACEGSERVTCSGSVATYCGGSRHTTVDCTRTMFRTRCAAGETSWEPCAPAGSECDPMSFRGECDGNKLKVCADGKIVSVACSDVGLASCEPAPPGHFARCREGT